MMRQGQDMYDIYSDRPAEGGGPAESHRGDVRRKRALVAALLLLLLLASLAAACRGSIGIPAADVLGHIFGLDASGDGRIVWNVRLVRIAAAILAGAGLAAAGAVMQCILRNPLASPYTLGLSSAAAFGAAFSIVFAGAGSMATSVISVSDPFATAFSAFVFSMAATCAILALVRVTRVAAETMVLAGIAIAAMFAAGLSFVQYVATDAQLANIVSWTFGDLGRASWGADGIALMALAPAAAYFFWKRWDYNAMGAGEDAARGLGVPVERVRLAGMVASALLCSVIVSLFGIIAFIGLLGPHIARMAVGGDHRHLLPASMAVGATIMVAADAVGKEILAPEVIPVGIVTSLLGGPLFVFLLIRRYRR